MDGIFIMNTTEIDSTTRITNTAAILILEDGAEIETTLLIASNGSPETVDSMERYIFPVHRFKD